MWDLIAILVLGAAALFVISIGLALLPLVLLGTAAGSWILIFAYDAGGLVWLIAIGSTIASLLIIFQPVRYESDVL